MLRAQNAPFQWQPLQLEQMQKGCPPPTETLITSYLPQTDALCNRLRWLNVDGDEVSPPLTPADSQKPISIPDTQVPSRDPHWGQPSECWARMLQGPAAGGLGPPVASCRPSLSPWCVSRPRLSLMTPALQHCQNLDRELKFQWRTPSGMTLPKGVFILIKASGTIKGFNFLNHSSGREASRYGE